MPRQTLLLDACVLINLLAGDILDPESTDWEFAICSVVEREAIFLRTDDPQNPRELIDLKPFIASGALRVVQPETDFEELHYVNFAAVLDDGEAMSLALATARGYAFATDDAKTRRVAAREIEEVRLLSTAELIRAWAEKAAADRSVVQSVLLRVERRARYVPRPGSPQCDWWEATCR